MIFSGFVASSDTSLFGCGLGSLDSGEQATSKKNTIDVTGVKRCLKTIILSSVNTYKFILEDLDYTSHCYPTH